jgi:hypothetical protein
MARSARLPRDPAAVTAPALQVLPGSSPLLTQLRHPPHPEACLSGGDRRDQAAQWANGRFDLTPAVPFRELGMCGEPVHVPELGVGDLGGIQPGTATSVLWLPSTSWIAAWSSERFATRSVLVLKRESEARPGFAKTSPQKPAHSRSFWIPKNTVPSSRGKGPYSAMLASPCVSATPQPDKNFLAWTAEAAGIYFCCRRPQPGTILVGYPPLLSGHQFQPRDQHAQVCPAEAG